MKYKTTTVGADKIILANDHYVAVPYDCTALTALATNHVIPAGTVIPSNDASAKGVLLTSVDLSENPNGTIVVHGFIRSDKLLTAPAETAKAALKLVQFV